MSEPRLLRLKRLHLTASAIDNPDDKTGYLLQRSHLGAAEYKRCSGFLFT